MLHSSISTYGCNGQIEVDEHLANTALGYDILYLFISVAESSGFHEKIMTFVN